MPCGMSVFTTCEPAAAISWNLDEHVRRVELGEHRLLHLRAGGPSGRSRSCRGASGRTRARGSRRGAARPARIHSATVVKVSSAWIGTSSGTLMVDAAERVDELLEALHVDEHVVLDRQPGDALRGIPHRLDAGLGALRDGVGVHLGALQLDLGVDRVELADVDLAAVDGPVALGIDGLQRRAVGERHVTRCRAAGRWSRPGRSRRRCSPPRCCRAAARRGRGRRRRRAAGCCTARRSGGSLGPATNTDERNPLAVVAR